MIMDFSLREWLLFLGIVVILSVLLDGFRRMQKGKRNSLKMSIDKNLEDRSRVSVDYFNGELPNGGAREASQQMIDEEIEPSKVDSNIQESVPADAAPQIDQGLMPEPLFTDAEDIVDPRHDHARMEEDVTELEPEPELLVPEQAEDEAPIMNSVPEGSPPPEVVIVINVFARDEKQFNGSELMQVILPCGMRYGHLDIFHRTEGDSGEGSVQFSMANAINPGTFDLETMDSLYTPGVSFFLGLPGPKNNMKAFDYMLETARCVAKNLNGELKDEQQSDLNPQIIGHSRQIIRDFERRQLPLLR